MKPTILIFIQLVLLSSVNGQTILDYYLKLSPKLTELDSSQKVDLYKNKKIEVADSTWTDWPNTFTLVTNDENYLKVTKQDRLGWEIQELRIYDRTEGSIVIFSSHGGIKLSTSQHEFVIFEVADGQIKSELTEPEVNVDDFEQIPDSLRSRFNLIFSLDPQKFPNGYGIIPTTSPDDPDLEEQIGEIAPLEIRWTGTNLKKIKTGGNKK